MTKSVLVRDTEATPQQSFDEAAYVGGALVSRDFLFTEEAANGPTYAITAVDQGAQTFTVAGDHVARFPADPLNQYTLPFIVTGSTGNDATYIMNSLSLVGGDTVINTVEAIPDTTVDGSIIAPRLYTASLAMAAGAVIDDIRLYSLSSGWAADTATFLTVADSVNDYYRNIPLTVLTNGLYNRYLIDGFASDTVRSLAGGTRSFTNAGAKPWEGEWALEDAFSVIVAAAVNVAHYAPGGGGRRFAADDTLVLLAAAVSATPPMAGTGVLLAKVIYWSPVSATDAVGS